MAIVVMVLFICCVLVGAQGLDPVRTAIDRYRAAIQLAQKDPSRGQLEAAFLSIEPLRQSLVSSRDGALSVLESLSEQEFTALSRELAGLAVNREEVVFIKPDGAFFRTLAARGKG